jgi:methylated-DNA-protein-cysteine methyltransferase related protein
MAKPSPFFARIKRDVLAIIASVPPGRLVTFKDIAAHLDIQARQVAYLLAMLEDADQARLPWFRAVPENGTLATNKSNSFGISQSELLRVEGIEIMPDGRILQLAMRLDAVALLPHAVPIQTRPADAPVAMSVTRKSRVTGKSGDGSGNGPGNGR